MKKQTATSTHTHKKEFEKLLRRLAPQYGTKEVFKDFLQLAICAFHVKTLQGQIDQDNEEKYFEVLHKYQKDQQAIFAQLLGTLLLITNDFPYQDFLGDFYMQNISNGDIGQFFTPYHIAQCMGGMMIDKEDTGNNIADCAAGSGVLLLATAAESPDNYFFAADIDEICVLMCTLNFFLNGLRGEVVHCNALSGEIWAAYRIHLHNFGIERVAKETTLQYKVHQRIDRDFERKQRKENPLSLFKQDKGTNIFEL